MKLSRRLLIGFQRLLPSPMSIAILLTLLTMFLALIYKPEELTYGKRAFQILGYWNRGFWSLMEFSMQMMLILVLGYVLALSKGVDRFIGRLTALLDTHAKAVVILSFSTLVVSLLNWGLGLVFGAIFARKIAEAYAAKGLKANYGLFGAAAYSGMMVWHGGLSGSAPLKIAEAHHFLVDKIGQIPLSETIFSSMNIFTSVMVLSLIPAFFYGMGRLVQTQELKLTESTLHQEEKKQPKSKSLDQSRYFAFGVATLILFIPAYTLINADKLNFLNLNFINTILFALAIVAQGSMANFMKAVQKAIGSSAGILVQFPMYAGIMGIMKFSGLYLVFTHFFLDISTTSSFPLFTLLSAAIVNIFVPSGGGQWIVQGPLVVDTAIQLGVSIPKSVMALAYGDQLSNMIQPFWALPLLGITGLKAKDIFPFSLLLMALGFIIFVLALCLF